MGDYDWIPEEDLKALEEAANMEKALHSEKTGAQLAETLLEEAAPQAAMSIIKIANADPNSNTRLRAATYIVDRVLGKAGQTPTENAPWDGIFAAVTEEASKR